MSRRMRLIFSVLILLLPACIGKDIKRPGESLGFFQVSGALREDTCGEAPSPWNFRVELRQDNAKTPRLYWAQGEVPIGADLTADGKAQFTAESSMVVSEKDAKKAGCIVVRSDAVNLALSADRTRFTGDLSYTYAAEPGSVCGNVTKAGIARVPCVTRYDLEGISADAGVRGGGAQDATDAGTSE
jgi:hypothetical protein